MNPARQPEGTPRGGQFATSGREEADIELGSTSSDAVAADTAAPDYSDYADVTDGRDADSGYGGGIERDPYCFVCSRPTSHYAEHEWLVAAGLAEYDAENGSVHRS